MSVYNISKGGRWPTSHTRISGIAVSAAMPCIIENIEARSISPFIINVRYAAEADVGLFQNLLYDIMGDHASRRVGFSVRQPEATKYLNCSRVNSEEVS